MLEQPPEPRSIVDFGRTARRLRTMLTVVGVLVIVVWLSLGIGDELTLRSLAELAGVGVLVAFVLEALIVGGSAVRGVFAAGERGDRLASSDVSLLPPQLTRRLRGARRR